MTSPGTWTGYLAMAVRYVRRARAEIATGFTASGVRWLLLAAQNLGRYKASADDCLWRTPAASRARVELVEALLEEAIRPLVVADAVATSRRHRAPRRRGAA